MLVPHQTHFVLRLIRFTMLEVPPPFPFHSIDWPLTWVFDLRRFQGMPTQTLMESIACGTYLWQSGTEKMSLLPVDFTSDDPVE